MYSFREQLALMKDLGVVGIKIYKISNGRPPLPGEKLTGGVESSIQGDQGFLGAFDSKMKATFILAVEVEWRDDLYVVWAEGRDRNIKPLGNRMSDAPTTLFSKRIPTDKTVSGDWVTKSTDNLGNSVWVISTANGQLQMWEVAIVTIVTNGQGKFYLSLQKVYSGDMFNNRYSSEDNFFVFIPEEQFPGYAEWYSLRGFLDSHTNRTNLKDISRYIPGPEEDPPVLVDGQAEVIWFNQAKGFGFVRVPGEEKNPIFHRTSIQNQEFPAFEPGQVIMYSSLDRTPRGAQLRGVTE